MRKTIMRLRSQLGTILDVDKQDEEYLLVAPHCLMMRKTRRKEKGVTAMMQFINVLMSLGWKNYDK